MIQFQFIKLCDVIGKSLPKLITSRNIDNTHWLHLDSRLVIGGVNINMEFSAIVGDIF